MIKTIIFKLALAIWFILWAPILLVGLVSKKLNRILVTTCARGCLWLPRLIVGIKYEIRYTENSDMEIPLKPNENIRLDGKAIIACKHMSILEIAILETHIPNSFFIIKRELLWIPIYGWCFWRMGLQPVNRKRGKTNMQKLTNQVAKKIRDGMVLIIFPEGTRSKPGQHPRLKRGLMFIAENLKLPIQPVGTNAGCFWPKHGKMKSGLAYVQFEPMLPCGANLEQIHEAINRHSA